MPEQEVITLGSFVNEYPDLRGKEGEQRQVYLEMLYHTKRFPVFINGKHTFFDNEKKEFINIERPIGTPLEFAPLKIFPKNFSLYSSFNKYPNYTDGQAFVFSLWYFLGEELDQNYRNHEQEILKKIVKEDSVIEAFRNIETELRELNPARCALLNLFIKDNKFAFPQYKNLREFGYDLISKGIIKEERTPSKEMFLFYRNIKYRNLEKLAGNFLNGEALVAKIDGIFMGDLRDLFDYRFDNGFYGIISTDELPN